MSCIASRSSSNRQASSAWSEFLEVPLLSPLLPVQPTSPATANTLTATRQMTLPHSTQRKPFMTNLHHDYPPPRDHLEQATRGPITPRVVRRQVLPELRRTTMVEFSRDNCFRMVRGSGQSNKSGHPQVDCEFRSGSQHYCQKSLDWPDLACPPGSSMSCLTRRVPRPNSAETSRRRPVSCLEFWCLIRPATHARCNQAAPASPDLPFRGRS